jgi:hypothetical protein
MWRCPLKLTPAKFEIATIAYYATLLADATRTIQVEYSSFPCSHRYGDHFCYFGTRIIFLARQ